MKNKDVLNPDKILRKHLSYIATPRNFIKTVQNVGFYRDSLNPNY